MFAKILHHVKRSLGPSGTGGRGERGFAILGLALAALIAGSMIAVPLLVRANSSLHSQTATNPLRTNWAASAAEHGLWRIGNDGPFMETLSGDPPSASYQLPFPPGPADVTITSSTAAVPDTQVSAFLNVTPNVVTPNTATTVTFTLRVVNNDSQTHYINRAEMQPQSFSPMYLQGTTTGFTTDDPVYTASRWRWDVIPQAAVPSHGGEVTLTWQMMVDQKAGNYWTRGSVRVEGIGTVDAPVSSFIRVGTVQDIEVEAAVSPSEVSAGVQTTFDYTITLRNNGSETVHINRVRFFTTTALSYVHGSTTGITTADPHISHDVINNRKRHSWSLSSVPLEPGVPLTLSLKQQGTLPPGVMFSVADVLVDEDDGASGHDATAMTGETAPVTSIRVYEVYATHGNRSVTVKAAMGASGVSVISWTGN